MSRENSLDAYNYGKLHENNETIISILTSLFETNIVMLTNSKNGDDGVVDVFQLSQETNCKILCTIRDHPLTPGKSIYEHVSSLLADNRLEVITESIPVRHFIVNYNMDGKYQEDEERSDGIFGNIANLHRHFRNYIDYDFRILTQAEIRSMTFSIIKKMQENIK